MKNRRLISVCAIVLALLLIGLTGFGTRITAAAKAEDATTEAITLANKRRQSFLCVL